MLIGRAQGGSTGHALNHQRGIKLLWKTVINFDQYDCWCSLVRLLKRGGHDAEPTGG